MANFLTKLFGKKQPTEVKNTTTWSVGQAGESLVLESYLIGGYQLVEQNFNYYSKGRGKKGEIDLILIKGDVLVFCEVKSRRQGGYLSGVESITSSKVRLLRSTAEYFLTTHTQYSNFNIRCDVASVTGEELNVIENAF
jgi:putative endonuclease